MTTTVTPPATGRARTRVDELLGRPGEHAGDGAAAHPRGADRAAAPAPDARGRLARRHLPRPLPRAVRVVVPGAAAATCYIAVLWMAAFAAVAMAVGFRARAATITVWAVVTYDLFLSTTNFHNNRAYLVLVLAALAVTPCDRELSLDAWLARRRGDPPRPTTSPGWPLWLLRFEAATVYGASGLSKLLDPDWFSGEVTWHRLVRTRHLLDASVLPPWSVDLLDGPVVQHGRRPSSSSPPSCSSPSACGRAGRATPRSGSPCASTSPSRCRRRSRCSRTWPIAALVIWSVPSTRDRTLHVDPARHGALVATVRSLDWLARFRIETGGRWRPSRSSTATARRPPAGAPP